MTILITILDLSLGLAGILILHRWLGLKSLTPLPPGPTKWPIIGNLLDVPSEKDVLTFQKWSEKWGDLVSFSVFGQKMIVVNSHKVALDMLEGKGSIYSERPIIQMGGELVGWKNVIALLPYGHRLRDYRRNFHRAIGSSTSMSQYYHVEEIETHKFLKRLLSSPHDLEKHLRQTAGSIILRISYGYETKETDDQFVILANIALKQFSLSTTPGGFLVNLIPPLRFIPDWFPGAGFKMRARVWAATLNKMMEEPFQRVKNQVAMGCALPSFAATLLTEAGPNPEKEFRIKWSAGSMYAGGTDTTAADLYAFFKAMVLYPEVAAAAQAEIDSVIGSDRLPSFDDRINLPYMNALVLEVLRWHVVAPTGIPHVVKEDDIHNGYLIPKGALIIPNIWKMQHDPMLYSDPSTFNPNRFLGPEPEFDPRQLCFGFGRRICPGRVLAEASIFISCAMTLAVFNISKSVDKSGRVIEPVVNQTAGTISHPTPFQCQITPRSTQALSLINEEIDKAWL